MDLNTYISRQATVIANRRLPARLERIVIRLSIEHKLPDNLLKAVILVECSKRPAAIQILERVCAVLGKLFNLSKSFTLGPAQVRVSSSRPFYDLLCNLFLSEAAQKLYILSISQSGRIKEIGSEYNGAHQYGLLLEHLNNRLAEYASTASNRAHQQN